MRGIAIALGWLICAAPASADAVFKCKNAEGVLQYQEKPCAGEAKSVSSWASKNGGVAEESEGSAPGPFAINRGLGGHYFVNGTVNDQYLNFIVDTGATFVSLPLSVAMIAGIKCRQRIAVNTANGMSAACTAVIAKLTFGRFTLYDVEAVIQPNLGQPLLGMNVLHQFRVEQDDGQMKLSKRY